MTKNVFIMGDFIGTVIVVFVMTCILAGMIFIKNRIIHYLILGLFLGLNIFSITTYAENALDDYNQQFYEDSDLKWNNLSYIKLYTLM